MSRALSLPPEQRPRYLEVPIPLVFPEEAEAPETEVHFELQTILYQLLRDHFGSSVTVGSDQFVYYDAADPKKFVAPDVYVRVSPRGEPIRSWRTWERGAPDIAVEVISESDASDAEWEGKLNRYRSVGVQELLRFHPGAQGPAVLRIWDRVNEALVERVPSSLAAPSLVLPLHWVVAEADGHPVALRIASGSDGRTLVPTRTEARVAETKARIAETKARETETKAREAAEARIAELEAELAKRRQ